MAVSTPRAHERAKVMAVSIGARPARAKATPVSREKFVMPAGYGGAWLRYPCAVAGPGRATSGRPTLQTSSNHHDLNHLTRTPVTNVVNLSPKTTIISEKAPVLTTFVTTGQKSTQNTPWIDDVCNNTHPATRQHTRHHRCGGRRRVRRAQEGLAAVPVGGGAWPGQSKRHGTTGVEGTGGACRGAGGRRRGLAGLRDDAPSEARGADDSRAGRRPPAHTAAGPSGARNTSGATSTAERRSLRTPRSTPGSGRPGGRRCGRAR